MKHITVLAASKLSTLLLTDLSGFDGAPAADLASRLFISLSQSSTSTIAAINGW